MKKLFLLFVLFFLFSVFCPLSSGVFANTVKEDFKEVMQSFLQSEYNETVDSSWRFRKRFPLSQYSSEAKYLSGLSYLKLKEYEKAEGVFKGLCEKRRSKDKFYLGWANCCYLQENWDEAVFVLKEALLRFGGTELKGAIYFKLAKSNQKKGEWATAKYYWTKLMRGFPEGLEAKQAKEILAKGEFYFTVQVGAFADRDNAQKVKYRLTQQNYPAYISVIDKKEGKFYRLRVGRFDLRKTAEAIKKNLEKEGYNPSIYP